MIGTYSHYKHKECNTKNEITEEKKINILKP